MDIRGITLDDFVQVQKLVCQVHQLHVSNRPDIFRDVDPFSRADFEQTLENPKAIALAAAEGETVIGFCIVTLRDPPQIPIAQRRVVAYMEDLCVDQAYRKGGVGRRLYKEAEARAREQGADVLELMAWAFNRPAIAFYETMGMTPRSYTMEIKL